jgi:uncharacterized OB-fold protein
MVYRSPSNEFAAEVPYIVAQVELAEGPFMMSRLVDCSIEHLKIDMPLLLAFREIAGNILPVFILDIAAGRE